MTTQLPTLELNVRNLYGTYRYFPACKVSTAICKVRGRKTLLLEDINTLANVGFTFRIYDERGEITTL